MPVIRGGFTGKILRLNLSTLTSTVEPLPDEVAIRHLGGAGLGTYIAYKEIPADADPLGPENKLIFAVGPLTGTAAPATSRMSVTSLSPLTNTIANSFSGGFFPAELKFAGYDAIIVEGRAERPTFVAIRDDKVSFHDATRLWGMGTFDTQFLLKEMLHEHNFRIACIGPAGENGSLLASIINEARACGRKGLGAVMGAKNLKAIAVRGTQPVPIADEARFRQAVSEINRHWKANALLYPVFSKTGSNLAVDGASALGIFPINNFRDTGTVDLTPTLGTEATAAYNISRNPCYRCPVGCSQVRIVRSGKYRGATTEGPEYETTFSLGSVVGVTSQEAVIYGDKLCDDLGLDTISAGVTIAWAMECHENGLLEETDGLDLSWGNDDTVLTLLRRIAYREGHLGDLLADGTRKAAQRLGKGSERYAMEVKGLEIPAYDPRGLKSHGLNFATSYNGADHNRGYAIQEVFDIPVPRRVDRFAVEGKGDLTKFNQDLAGIYDTATFCEFPFQMGTPHVAGEITAKLLTGATGYAFTGEMIWQAGERLYTLARMFNVRRGFDRKDDTLPARFMEEEVKGGNSAGQRITREELDTMLDEYYAVRGWDSRGIPTAETLQKLDLEFAVSDRP